MTRSLVLGIDPGLSGAWALYDMATRGLVALADLPVRGEGSGTRIDCEALLLALGLACESGATADTPVQAVIASRVRLAVVEDVFCRPGEGVSSVFKFGRSAGAVEGFVGGLFIPLDVVRPQAWKGGAGLTGTEKHVSNVVATQLWPEHAKAFKAKTKTGKADAALIARHGALALLGGRA